MSTETFAKDSNLFGILLDKTNFYAEQGGQEYDTGLITNDATSTAFSVENVQVYGGYVLHVGYLKDGSIAVGDTVLCSFDEVIASSSNALTDDFRQEDGHYAIITLRRIY